MAQETSVSLLQRLRQDEAATDWRNFTQMYEPLIRNWLRRKDVLGHDADDLAQNIMAVVVRKVGQFEHNGRTGAFRTWLRTITVNCVREHWRASRDRPVGVGGSDVQEMLAQLEDPESRLTKIWNEEHDRYVMRQLLEKIREEFTASTWQAFQRFALDGVSAADVALELGISSNAVFVAKSRILARLRQESAGLLDE